MMARIPIKNNPHPTYKEKEKEKLPSHGNQILEISDAERCLSINKREKDSRRKT